MPAGLKNGDFAALLKGTGSSLDQVNSALAASRHFESLVSLKSDIERYAKQAEVVQVQTPDLGTLRALQEETRRKRANEQETLELLRRTTVASEQAIADAQRRERDAKMETRRAYAIAVVGAVVGLAGLLLAAWPFILARLEAL